MTPAQYRDALDRLDWSQRSAARFFGVDERTSRAWAKLGSSGPPEAVAMWLVFMLKTRMTPAEIEQIISSVGPIVGRS